MRFKGEQLAADRAAANMTQQDLAEKLKTMMKCRASRVSVHSWETGKAVPRAEFVVALCTIFDRNIREYFE